MDPGFRRLDYVRYADDFIIGIRGTYIEAEYYLNKINQFLALPHIQLPLNLEKTRITNIGKDKILFLGTYIYKSKVTSYARTVYRLNEGSKRILRRNSFRLRLDAPIQRIRTK